jgi:PTH1 family peptidyl-tRNA hydrolase
VKLIVGLGNPGAQYERTRHNAGFMAVDRLADRHARGGVPRARFNALTLEASIPGAGAEPERCLLMKPLTYMNRSGQAVAEALRFYKLEPVSDLLVIVDDIYLPAGAVRLRGDGSPAGHNGLADISRALGGDGWSRCRIGIDAPGVIPQADYVLGRFTESQWPEVDKALTIAADAAEAWAHRGISFAGNKFNTKGPQPPREPKEPTPPGAAAAPSTPPPGPSGAAS